MHAAQYALRMAAAEAGAFAYDAAFPGLEDEAGFRAEADAARALGFAGKSCVHPRQVAWANAAFAPSVEEVDAARRTVAAAEGSAGVYAVDGRMVDAPFLARARRPRRCRTGARMTVVSRVRGRFGRVSLHRYLAMVGIAVLVACGVLPGHARGESLTRLSEGSLPVPPASARALHSAGDDLLAFGDTAAWRWEKTGARWQAIGLKGPAPVDHWRNAAPGRLYLLQSDINGSRIAGIATATLVRGQLSVQPLPAFPQPSSRSSLRRIPRMSTRPVATTRARRAYGGARSMPRPPPRGRRCLRFRRARPSTRLSRNAAN